MKGNEIVRDTKEINSLLQLLRRFLSVFTNNNTLPVTLSGGDIEIGAVEIKDATTNNRLVVNANGSINTTDTPIESIISTGTITLSNTVATVVDNSEDATCISLIVTASITNTGYVRVGGSDVDLTTGIVLYPGESVELNVNISNIIYAIAEVNAETISTLININS